MIATISPKTVVKATFIPPATSDGEISPTASMASNAPILPITGTHESEHGCKCNE